MRKAVVSISSWPPRISQVAGCVKSLLDQSVVPDEININLSDMEFPGQEDDLPRDLVELVEQNHNVVINWEHGNTFVFRKEVPVVKKHFGEDCVMLSCDDDIRYAHGFVERMLSNMGDADAYNDEPGVVGFKQASNLRKFGPEFWTLLNQEVIKAGISDTWHFYYLLKVKANCKWGPRDPVLDAMCDGVACDISPNSERIGGYNQKTMSLADRLTREALGLC